MADTKHWLAHMVRSLHHRGPDSSGLQHTGDGAPWLGQARLAIVDLSEQGRQPMQSASGRYWLTFNGEIYNHLQLRQMLGPQPWRGHSDTETLLAVIERLGIEEALRLSVGMFAIALWDVAARTLTLARDRLGEKPLYVASLPGGMAFASELKALLALPGLDLATDDEAVGHFLQRGCVPAPWTVHRGVRKLLPGHLMQLTAPTDSAAPRAWWRLPDGQGALDPADDAQALCEFERLLLQSLQGQRLADVPLGSFLSGGVDSSLVTALLQTISDRPVRSFSIGFTDSAYDESNQARAVARHLGTDHTELQVSANDALALVPTLVDVWDEPFADASQIPTLLLAQLTRKHVTVALSGDGGDELFGGYNRHMAAMRLEPRLRAWPQQVRRVAAAALHAVPAAAWDAGAGLARRLVPAKVPSALGEKVDKLASLIGASDAADGYRVATRHWPASALRFPAPTQALAARACLTMAEQMMVWDLQSYLPDDVLVKVDRAAMRHSLETRVPLLDHRLVEFAMRQPVCRKIRGRTSKWLMRQLLYQHVPRELIERPKQGFSVPLDAWLRGPLRGWADELLAPAAMKLQPWLDAAAVGAAWADHLSGRKNNAQRLWTALMLMAWHRRSSGAAA